MAKLIIRNTEPPEWNDAIETKADLMLSSILPNIRRMEVDFGCRRRRDGAPVAYTCTLLVVEKNGKKHTLHNEQPDATLAIEGALARARRAMTRIGRSRSNTRRQASAR